MTGRDVTINLCREEVNGTKGQCETLGTVNKFTSLLKLVPILFFKIDNMGSLQNVTHAQSYTKVVLDA